jgi:hypothetical protein
MSAVTLSVTTCARALANASLLLYGPSDWNVKQAVSISATNDEIVMPSLLCAVELGPAVSSDPVFALAQASAQVAVLDANTAGVNSTITDSAALRVIAASADLSFSVVRGNSGQILLTLLSKPLFDVVLTLRSAQPQTLSLSGVITIVPSSWNTTQAAGITALTSAVLATPTWVTLYITASSADPAYSFAERVLARALVIDSDVNRVVQMIAAQDAVRESSTSTEVSVMLTREITSPLVVTLSNGNSPRATVSPQLLTLQPTDYLVPVPITVTTVSDNIARGNTTVAVAAAWVWAGESFSASTIVSVADDDIAALVLSQTPLRVNETGACFVSLGVEL